MGRGYTAEGYAEIVAQARASMPGLGLSTDVMVGFPGETEAQFENTYRLLERLEFDQAFTFKFSPRPGTAAEKMPEQVPEAAKQARLVRLAALVARVAREVNRRQLGEVQEVLVEGEDPRGGGRVRGRSRANKLVILRGGPALIGQTVRVVSEEAYLWGFSGDLLI
jgi:tRNA-2-methylthio-N6-dimethylallyladenosine synthase